MIILLGTTCFLYYGLKQGKVLAAVSVGGVQVMVWEALFVSILAMNIPKCICDLFSEMML